MFGIQPSPKKQVTFGWYILLAMIGLGALLFSVQSSLVPANEKQTANPPSTQSQTDALLNPITVQPQNDPNDESYLPQYDPKAVPFLANTSEDERPLWLSGGEFVLKLLLVIGLIYLALTGLRWLQKSRQQLATRGATIRILETTGLAPGRSLHLVIVGEKTLLIGATDHHLSVLAELTNVITPLHEEESVFDETLSKAASQINSTPTQEWQTAFENLRNSMQRIRHGMSR